MICYVGVAEGKGRPRRRGWMSMWTEYNPHSVVVRAIVPRSVLAKLQHRAAKESRTLSELVGFILTKEVDEK